MTRAVLNKLGSAVNEWSDLGLFDTDRAASRSSCRLRSSRPAPSGISWLTGEKNTKGKKISGKNIAIAGHVVGQQRMRLIAPGVAFKITGLNGPLEPFAEHARRLLAHVDLRAIAWVNVNMKDVTFTTLERPGPSHFSLTPIFRVADVNLRIVSSRKLDPHEAQVTSPEAGTSTTSMAFLQCGQCRCMTGGPPVTMARTSDLIVCRERRDCKAFHCKPVGGRFFGAFQKSPARKPVSAWT